MNAAELARRVAALEGLPEYRAQQILRSAVAAMSETLQQGGSVVLAGLCTIGVTNIKRTEFVNPRQRGGTVTAAGTRYKLKISTAAGMFDNPPGVISHPPGA